MHGFGSTGFKASTTYGGGYAAQRKKTVLRPKGLCFGIGTPRTAKRTAFQKNNRTYAIPVMNAEFLNIDDSTSDLVHGELQMSGGIKYPAAIRLE